MNAMTMTIDGTRTAPRLERVTAALLLGFVAALQVSIALAHILLTAMLLSWVLLRVRERARPAAPAFFLPLAVYAALTLVSSSTRGVDVLDAGMDDCEDATTSRSLKPI